MGFAASKSTQRIYLDYSATYPTCREHLEDLVKTLCSTDCNPSSTHSAGRDAKRCLEQARRIVGEVLGAPKKHIVFTSGATESNNTVLRSAVYSWHKNNKTSQNTLPRVVISAIEHPSLFQLAESMRLEGLCELVLCPVDKNGLVDSEQLLDAINSQTCLASIMLVNNEVGTINPVAQLFQRIKEKQPDVLCHSDVVQGLGKLDLSWLHNSAVDTAALSGHKIGALKGVGALYAKDFLNLMPLLVGGGQESCLRSGTENIPGIVSFGMKCQEILENLPAIEKSVQSLRAKFVEGLEKLAMVNIHSQQEFCVPHIINCGFISVSSAAELFISLDEAGICVSTGSACSSAKAVPSRVLLAMGYSPEEASNSIRFSLSHNTNSEELIATIAVLDKFLAAKAIS
ncbi:MAG: cysteine desulfurase [Oligoflexales bacterium]|nr:cysteine desulfurase [Oligoflexales bacterium]